MIEHVTITVEDLDAARDFYEALLAPLGYDVTRRLPDHDDGPRVAFGRDRRAQLWLVEGGSAHEGVVLALHADDADAVEAFRAAAEGAGADEVSDAEEGADGRLAASAKDGSGNRIVAVAGGSGRGMIDHVQLVVSDFGRTLRFYEKLLEPLDVAQTARDLDNADGPRVGFGQGGETSLWLTEEGDPQSGVAIGFSAASERQVDEFHSNAVDAGGRKIEAANTRKEVGPNYYVSGALDPDSNRIEAVHDGEHGLEAVAPVRHGADKLAEAAALQKWEAERAQAKAAEMAEAEKRSGRNFATLSSTPLVMAPPEKPAAKDADAEEGDDDALAATGDDDDAFDLSSLGLDDGEDGSGDLDLSALGLDDDSTTSASSDDGEIDWAALGLDDGDAETTPAASGGDDEEIDWAALGLDDDSSASSEDDPLASLGLGDDEEDPLAGLGLDDEEEAKPKKKEEKPKPRQVDKSAMGLDF